MSVYERLVLAVAARSGISVGAAPTVEVRVRDPSFYRQLVLRGSVGAGESYMAGQWECDNIPALVAKLADAPIPAFTRLPALLHQLRAACFNLSRRSRAFEIGRRHYDAREDVYEAMLDPYRQYTCGYWKNAASLAEAQRAKMDLICRKLHLEPGMRVLDIGCGWGGLAKYMAENYGATVDGISVSQDQIAYARTFCKGLPATFHLLDYRDMGRLGAFDRVVSVGMFEHVGPKNYRAYMAAAHGALKDGGLFLLHTIGSLAGQAATDPWISARIFPNSCLPWAEAVTRAGHGLFVQEGLHNFGPYYAPTLQAWYENFMQAWPTLRARYSEEFRRMWEYYLLSCKGCFQARKLQLWQFVFSKNPTALYEPVR